MTPGSLRATRCRPRRERDPYSRSNASGDRHDQRCCPADAGGMGGGWGFPPRPSKCSLADAQRPGALVHSGSYLRYCGSGRAVVRVGGKSFHHQWWPLYIAPGGLRRAGTSRRRGFSLVLDHHNWPGRNAIIQMGSSSCPESASPRPLTAVRPSSPRTSRARPFRLGHLAIQRGSPAAGSAA